uniref:HIRA-interacting protein 3 n=1 Tax=Heliothis virescens TaxID=7102 RepID=A0A2A4ITH5_HELVI
MNYEAERAMNQKRLRMEGEPGHGVVQGNGLPLNYIDNGHQIPYQPYAGAYNTHYPPPEAFSPYGPPPPGGYAPQNLSYAPPAHQNYPHHQSFPPQQPPQAQLHMPQSHMGYGDVGVHKPAWPPQPHLLPPLDTQKPLDVKQLKSEIKLEPTDAQKRPHPESEMMARQREFNVHIPSSLGGDLDQPKIKIKTDIFKPDDLAHRQDKPIDVGQKPLSIDGLHKPADMQSKDDGHPIIGVENKSIDKPTEACKAEAAAEGAGDSQRAAEPTALSDKSEEDRKPFSSPELPKSGSIPGKVPTPGSEYAIRPFRKDFSGIQFRRRWSDDCLDSSHIPNEVYFGDVPVSLEVLYNYYDANAERERLAAQAAHIAAQKAAAAKLAAAKLQARGLVPQTAEVTTVDSSSSDDSDGSSGSDSEESDEDTPLKRGPGRPKGSKNSPRAPGTPGAGPGAPATPGSGRRGRPPVPPELRQPGITDMKKFCKAAGIRFDYKKLVEGCTKNKERVQKMLDLLTAAGLEGKPTLEKCQALKKAKMEKKEQEKQAKKEAKYAIRPFRKDFSGIQFRRRWSDDCLDSSHIPNEVYFGDVPVSLEVLYNYYDANAERERLAAQAAHIAAQKAAAAKLAAAKLQARGLVPQTAEVTTVDSSSSDDSDGSSGSDSEESDEDTPLKRGPGRPKGSKNSPRAPGTPGAGPGAPATPGSGRRGRPPVPPELRQPGITDMKKFCKAAGIRFDYKKLVEGCTKNKERVQKMLDLLTAAGLEGKPTLEKCQALKKAKMEKKEQEKQAKKEAKVKHKEVAAAPEGGRRMTRGATGVKPRQRIVISSDEEDDTPAARRTLSKLRSSLNDDSDSD